LDGFYDKKVFTPYFAKAPSCVRVWHLMQNSKVSIFWLIEMKSRKKNNPCASVLAMPPIQAREYIQDFLGENSV